MAQQSFFDEKNNNEVNENAGAFNGENTGMLKRKGVIERGAFYESSSI